MRNISVKELNYINDMLSWELLSMKKAYQYAHQEQDSSHHQVFIGAAKVHFDNYMKLLNYIDNVNEQQGGQMH